MEAKTWEKFGGMPLTKFGLWKYKQRKDYADTFESDSTYAWNGKYGKQRTQAFRKIISIVTEIAKAANRGDWEYVAIADFHAAAKWKIAFLYSANRVVPIYTREGLLKVAAGLGGSFSEDVPIVELQSFIAEKKPIEEGMIEYAQDLWEHYVKGRAFRNYFIVGTKYKDENGNDSKDVFPDMLASSSIAIGFLYNYDLTSLAGASLEEINNFIEENSKEEYITISKLQSYFRILLHLKPGDIIAIKSQGAYGNLEIIAYAVITRKNGKVYEYRPNVLGHHINVEFVELGISRRTGLNYAGTVHQVSSDKPDHLRKIFGPFLQVDNIALGAENDDDTSLKEDLKSEESYVRGAIASRMIRQLHNIIQNSFYLELRKQYPHQKITMEFKGRVDIVRESDTERWFYEIKPFENILSCLREATGQLIEYSFRFQDSTKNTNLVIVGPGELRGEAIGFFDHYVESIKLPLSYEQHIAPSHQDVN